MAENDPTLLGVPIDMWLLFIIVMVVTGVIARAVYVLLRRYLDPKVSKRRSKNVARLAEYAILVTGLYIGIFAVLQVNATALVASLGIAGIAIAFASQQIIQNFMAGVLMGVDRRVQVEDWVEIIGSSVKAARVRDITLTKTILLDPGGRQVYVPNALLITSQVINYTKAGFVEVPIEVKVRMADIDKVTEVMLEVADKEDKVLPNVDPHEREQMESRFKLMPIRQLFDNHPPVELFKPRVLVSKIDGADVILSVRIWIMEVQKRDEIVSSFLMHVVHRCNQENLCFSAF